MYMLYMYMYTYMYLHLHVNAPKFEVLYTCMCYKYDQDIGQQGNTCRFSFTVCLAIAWLCVSMIQLFYTVCKLHVHVHIMCINAPTTTSVKISQNVDIHVHVLTCMYLPRYMYSVYLVHLTVKHCQTCQKYMYMSWPFLTGKSIVLYCWGWLKWQ